MLFHHPRCPGCPAEKDPASCLQCQGDLSGMSPVPRGSRALSCRVELVLTWLGCLEMPRPFRKWMKETPVQFSQFNIGSICLPRRPADWLTTTHVSLGRTKTRAGDGRSCEGPHVGASPTWRQDMLRQCGDTGPGTAWALGNLCVVPELHPPPPRASAGGFLS